MCTPVDIYESTWTCNQLVSILTYFISWVTFSINLLKSPLCPRRVCEGEHVYSSISGNWRHVTRGNFLYRRTWEKRRTLVSIECRARSFGLDTDYRTMQRATAWVLCPLLRRDSILLELKLSAAGTKTTSCWDLNYRLLIQNYRLLGLKLPAAETKTTSCWV